MTACPGVTRPHDTPCPDGWCVLDPPSPPEPSTSVWDGICPRTVTTSDGMGVCGRQEPCPEHARP